MEGKEVRNEREIELLCLPRLLYAKCGGRLFAHRAMRRAVPPRVYDSVGCCDGTFMIREERTRQENEKPPVRDMLTLAARDMRDGGQARR